MSLAGRARPGSLAANALGMTGGRVASMALGFLFWLAAARLFDPERVGLAAGVVAAMMLCTQLALLGVGSACIVLLPRHGDRTGPLLDTAVTVVALSSLAVGGCFLALASVAFADLGTVAASPAFVVLFLAMCVLGTENILFDQVSMAAGRGAQVLTRNLAFGAATLATLVLVGIVDPDAGALGLFSPWVVGGAAACALGVRQLRRAYAGGRLRPRLSPGLRGDVVRVGLPNHLLTLTERAPGLALPIVVTELLSPVQNAFWYGTWMAAWAVYVVPLSVGMAVFADGARRPERLDESIRSGTRVSLLWSVAGAAGLALLAEPVLGLLGPEYARAGATPLRVLVLAVVPLTVVQAYYAACRARGRLREAIVTGAVTGAVAVAAAALAARPAGLAGMAWAWVGTQAAAGAWAAARLRAARPAPADAPKEAGIAAPVVPAVAGPQ